MLKTADKIVLVLLFLLTSYACQENETVTKDVLISVLINDIKDTTENRVDSIVLEYTTIDSITQFVKRTFYSRTLEEPYSFNYKLINNRTKAYMELPYDTLKSIYLDTETFNDIILFFNVPTKNLDGCLQYRYNVKDSINNINYYVFQGHDVVFSRDTDWYFYFDSIFHLKKIYDTEGILRFSVN